MNQYSRAASCQRRHRFAFRIDARGWRVCRVCDAERNRRNRAARRCGLGRWPAVPPNPARDSTGSGPAFCAVSAEIGG